jgi:hypothetical protein
MIRLKDNIFIGVLFGLIGPIIGVVGFYLYNFSNSAFLDFFKMAARQNLLSPLLSLCAVINLGIFYLFIQRDYLYIGRGVIFSTFVYGLIIVAFKFIW